MNKIPEQFRKLVDVRQLLLVRCCGGPEAEARYYTKGAAGWRFRGGCHAFIGKNGPGKEREGDLKTPLGVLRPLRAFGILPDPGCALPYLRVTPGTYACDGQGPCYNRIVQVSGSTDAVGEKMWELSPEYDYGLETDFNKECIWPLGSAIFVHCKGAKSWTGGCIALNKPLMKKIIMTADGGMMIRIVSGE